MKNNKIKGFSLIELILVLFISSMAFLGFLKSQQKETERLTATNAGEQISQVGEALERYIDANRTALLAIAPATLNATPFNFTALQGTANFTPGAAIPSIFPYLPLSYQNNNILGGAYTIRLRNNAGALTGIVSTTPFLDSSGSVRFDWLGTATRKIGAKGGYSGLVAANTANGYNGAWAETSGNYPNLTAAGQLVFFSNPALTTNFDGAYLRRDGGNRPTADINWDAFNLVNANGITANALASVGATLLLNGTTNINAIAPNINLNAGTTLGLTGAQVNITSNTSPMNIISPSGVIVNGEINNSGTAVTNNAVIRTRDIFINPHGGGGPSTLDRTIAGGGGRWLSDLLPKYVSRGIYYRAINGLGAVSVPKPICANGTTTQAKVEVIPQASYVQSSLRMTSGANEYSLGSWVTYAVNSGPNWDIYIQTPNYLGAGSIGGWILAHVYCDEWNN